MEQPTMAILLVLLSLSVLLAITLADSEDPVAKLQGRVYIKNLQLQKYLVFDPLSRDAEPKALLWNVPQTLPPRGGAWFHMARSPIQTQVDYNLVGGAKWNFTLCVSMKQPVGEDNIHFVHGNVDEYHMGAPECRWKIVLSSDKRNYWLINSLYGGHLTVTTKNFNVDPLRKLIFVVVKVVGDDDREKWQIDTVLLPNDRKSEDDIWVPGDCEE